MFAHRETPPLLFLRSRENTSSSEGRLRIASKQYLRRYCQDIRINSTPRSIQNSKTKIQLKLWKIRSILTYYVIDIENEKLHHAPTTNVHVQFEQRIIDGC